MLRRIFILSLISLIFIGITGCNKKEKPKNVSLEKIEIIEETINPPQKEPLRISVGSMATPMIGFAYYFQLFDYIENKLGKPVKFVSQNKYQESHINLKSGNIDVAFVCSRPYVNGHDEFGLELLAAPQVNGKTIYYSYIIVPINSPIKNLEGLREKTFAFADPMSNSGKLVPTYMLAKIGETPDTFFKRYFYTFAHDKSIKAVAEEIADGAAVDSLIWDYMNNVNPELTSKTKVIEKSAPYGIPPVVVRPGIDPETKEKLRQIFLNLHKDEKGREILKGMMIDKFVVIEDSAYDSIRDIQRQVAKHKEEKHKH